MNRGIHVEVVDRDPKSISGTSTDPVSFPSDTMGANDGIVTVGMEF